MATKVNKLRTPAGMPKNAAEAGHLDEINNRLDSLQTSVDSLSGGTLLAFTQLTDTFTSYAGKSLQSLRVNAGESGLEPFTSTATFTSTDQTIAASTTLTVGPHGLGATPTRIWGFLVNVTPEYNYLAGDLHLADLYPFTFTTSGNVATVLGCSVIPDATNITVIFPAGHTSPTGTVFEVLDKSTRALQFITNASWHLRLFAQL